ncbi:MAG: TIGR04283 family arsenosugar biosynthesis glycosyltransferase [Planctomycetota bacterium]|jgi:rSAM/selenodomain-associated transferase 2
MSKEEITSTSRHTRRGPTECRSSIIVPVLHEAERINSLVDNIHSQCFERALEIIVVDGDQQGSTIKAIKNNDVISLTSAKGRAQQMNAGAAVARGEILIFLHADTELPLGALGKISHVLENEKYVAGAFDLEIDSDRLFLKYIAARARLRSRLNRIPYGDQAIFIRKGYFDKIGRFKEIPLMEDVDLMQRIKKKGDKIFILRDRVKTSARRWEKEGLLYTTLKNQLIASLYYLGVSPDKLAKFYRSHR